MIFCFNIALLGCSQGFWWGGHFVFYVIGFLTIFKKFLTIAQLKKKAFQMKGKNSINDSHYKQCKDESS